MLHNIEVEGFGIRLRPVRMKDAPFIVWLRGLDHVKGKIGDSATDIASQECWLRAYFQREGDYYFISETPSGVPLGTHGIYDVYGQTGEKGRQVIRPEVMAGVPTAILATDIAFERLGLSELRSTTVSTNLEVRSLHRKSGFKELGITPAAQVIGGKSVDLVHFLLTPVQWYKVRTSILPLAHIAGEEIKNWEETQIGVSPPWERSAICS
jgi:RimJ/RimL family protein N-acetyltransferase